MKVIKTQKNKNEFQQEFNEIISSYNKKITLSVCSIKINGEKNISKVLFFIPEMGMSYKNYYPYFEFLLDLNIFDEIITFDHIGNGISGGVRGINASGKKYLEDCKNVFSQFVKKYSNIIVFGHGFGATLALIIESEGFFKNVQGIIIKDPFLNKINHKGMGKRVGQLINLKKIKRYIMLETFLGKEYFPTIEDQLVFDVECLNSRSFSLDFLDTLNELTNGVIERAYLAEKPILFLHGMKKSSELVTLYQKGVGENKVTSVELSKDGHFENFKMPVRNDLMMIASWVNNLNGATN